MVKFNRVRLELDIFRKCLLNIFNISAAPGWLVDLGISVEKL